jgi:hypothetical protein
MLTATVSAARAAWAEPNNRADRLAKNREKRMVREKAEGKRQKGKGKRKKGKGKGKSEEV